MLFTLDMIMKHRIPSIAEPTYILTEVDAAPYSLYRHIRQPAITALLSPDYIDIFVSVIHHP